jgi:hypothetical protein
MRALGLTVLLLGGAVLGAGPASGAPDSCAALGGVTSANTCQIKASVPAYTLDINFPLDYPDEQAILDYVSQTRDSFVNFASGSRKHRCAMVTGWETITSARTRSDVLSFFQDNGDGHPTSWFKAFTYDTARGVPVTFDTLFAAGSDPLKVIFPIVQRELAAQGSQVTISPDEGMKPSLYQNFAITNDWLRFYFGSRELMPGDLGNALVNIPRSELPPLQV